MVTDPDRSEQISELERICNLGTSNQNSYPTMFNNVQPSFIIQQLPIVSNLLGSNATDSHQPVIIFTRTKKPVSITLNTLRQQTSMEPKISCSLYPLKPCYISVLPKHQL